MNYFQLFGQYQNAKTLIANGGKVENFEKLEKEFLAAEVEYNKENGIVVETKPAAPKPSGKGPQVIAEPEKKN